MLVCPTCHHELPVAKGEFASAEHNQVKNKDTAKPLLFPSTCGFAKGSTSLQCHPPVAPSCHIAPLCHDTRTCHVTPACRMAAPCHVTPYVCDCSLNHNTTSSVQQDLNNTTNTSSSHNGSIQPCSHNVDNHNHIFHHNNSTMQNQLDSSNLKLFNLSSCPTSPSTPINQCNLWPSSVSQIRDKNLIISSHASKEQHPSNNQCSTSHSCAFHSSNNQQGVVHRSSLDLSSSNHHSNTESNHQSVCSNSVCHNARTNFGRQMSCPNTTTCVDASSCPCLQRQKSIISDKHHHMHNHQQQLVNKLNTVDMDTQQNTAVPQQVQQDQCMQQPFSQFQFHVPDQSQLQSIELCLQTELQHNKGDNIVILNSSSGGGMIIERKEPSRSNSPELKMTLSLPLTNSQSSSGSISPITVNTVSFDREALMQTLASLPRIASTTSSVLVSQSNGNNTNPTISFSVSNQTSPQTFSTISFPSVSPTPSTDSSCSPSPLSFTANDKFMCSVNSRFDKISSTNFTGGSSEIPASSNLMSSAHHMFSCEAAVQRSSDVVAACDWTSSDDARVLRKARAELEECGWYYGGLTWREAGAVLSGSPEGSFLVRDSWSGRCLYALSLQTSRGPTSVRIEYENGKFRLDSETGAREGVPRRCSVVALVEAYTQTRNPAHVWVDHSGQTISAISVKKPLRKNPPSLQHIARLAYNSIPVKQELLNSGIPNLIKAYLNSYPHSC